jgi:hypothetical protein
MFTLVFVEFVVPYIEYPNTCTYIMFFVVYTQDHPHFEQVMAYLRDSHQEVQAASGHQSWWDSITIARNLVESSQPSLVYPDDGDENLHENSNIESKNVLIGVGTLLRTEVDRLCLMKLETNKAHKTKKKEDRGDNLRKANPQSYVS